MFSTVEFLDAIKDKYQLRSDYALAKFMGWRQTRISQYRVKERELDDDGCIQVAEKLDLPPAHVMACIASRRADNAASKRYWEEAAKLLKDEVWVLALIAVGAFAQVAPAPAPASAVCQIDPLYIMRRWRGRDRRRPWRRRRRSVRTVTAAAAE